MRREENRKKISDLQKRVTELEESRMSLLLNYSKRMKEKAQTVKDYKKAVEQIETMCTSILMSVALENGGEITYPQDTLNLISQYSFSYCRNPKERTVTFRVWKDEQIQK